MKGIDISSYQGNNINFNAVKADGIEAVIVKATESINYTNMYFDSHTQGVINAGLKLGFYHFFRGQGIVEADYFCDTIAPYKDKMAIKPVIDVEVPLADINNQVLAFINRVKERLGIDCIIYSGAYFAGDNLTDTRLLDYGLWVAHYDVSIPALSGIWKDYIGHQYSSTAIVNGISGGVDINVFKDEILINKFKEEDYYMYLFSENWYLWKYNDVATVVKECKLASGYEHYIKYGREEGRQPVPPIPENFKEKDYLELNPDVEEAVNKGIYVSGAHHYLMYGFKETFIKVSKTETDTELKNRIKELEEKILNAKKSLE